MTFNTVEREIEPILQNNIATRCDDMFLYACYVNAKGASVNGVFTNKNYRLNAGIAPYETVSRIRRMLQAKYADLRPTPAQIAEKKRAEKEYRAYARERGAKQ